MQDARREPPPELCRARFVGADIWEVDDPGKGDRAATLARFTGSQAEDRARAYAQWRNRRLAPTPDAETIDYQTRERLGYRVVRFLNIREIYTFSDLAKWTIGELKWERGIGTLGLSRIRRELAAKGLRLSDDYHEAASQIGRLDDAEETLTVGAWM